MSAPHGLCPECLARVLPSWSICKFCGHTLVGVVPAPWEEPEAAQEQPSRATSLGDGASFFDLYGDFNTSTIHDEPIATPAIEAIGEDGEQLALPAAPGDEIPETNPYDLPFDEPDTEPSAPYTAAAPPGGGGPSLFGGREQLPTEPSAPASATPSSPTTDDPLGEEPWWMHDPRDAPAESSASTQTWEDEPGAWADEPSDDLAAPVSFEASSWDEPPPPPSAGGLATLQAPVAVLPPASKPPLLSREVRLFALGILFLLVVSIAFAVVDSAGSKSYPAAWDPRVVRLARFATQERGQGFRHPVPVHFLSASAYADEVRRESDRVRISDDDLAEQDQALRALGIVQRTASAPVNRADLDGPVFYSFAKGALYVRGSTITPRMAPLVVAQLDHALNAQLYGRSSLDGGARNGFLGWATMDASGWAASSAYVAQLSKEERATYDAAKPLAGPKAPTSLDGVLAAAPRTFGDLFGQVLYQGEGWPVIDRALQFVPTADAQIFDPYRYLDGDRGLHVDPAPLGDGEKRLSETTLGATRLYLVLANQIDPHLALAAADAWSGDTMTTFRKDGRVCVDLRVRGAADSDRGVLERAAQTFVSTIGSDWVQTRTDGDVVVLRGCDPAAGAGGQDRSATTVLVPLLRTKLAADLYDRTKDIPNGVNGPILSIAQTRCVAQHVIDSLSTDRLLDLANDPVTAQEAVTLTDQFRGVCKPEFTPSSVTS